jgi:hypothetical protein
MCAAAMTATTFAACDNGDDTGNTGNDETEKGIVLSGSLSQATRATDGQTFRATIDDQGNITGKLQDGSITFELSGSYNSATGVFSMQAPSSSIIFSIVGRLNASGQVIVGETSASVKVKVDGEWVSTELSITIEDVTVEGSVNADQTDVTKIPAVLHGHFTDQITALAVGQPNEPTPPTRADDDETGLRYTVTENSITMFDGSNAPQDITILEVTNADGSAANSEGPWNLLVSAVYGEQQPYIGRFYVARTFDAKLTEAIGGSPVDDLFFGTNVSDATISQVISATPSLQGATMYVTPYCAETGVTTTGIYPAGTFSPLFTDPTATVDAKAATTLKAISGFTLVLK